MENSNTYRIQLIYTEINLENTRNILQWQLKNKTRKENEGVDYDNSQHKIGWITF
jgi:hypothetical protein